jgi:cytochrome c-type biogenesis protein
MSQTGFGSAAAFALTTGVVTAFNPCGFAMLPAYISYFVGSTSNDKPRSAPQRVARAGVVGFVVTLGFVTVFGIMGLLASEARSSVNQAVPYISMVVGVVLVLLAVAMFRGYEPKLSFLKVGKMQQGSSLKSMYVYGLSYAVVSLSCGFGTFLGAVASAFRQESVARSFGVYLAFSAGMGLVLLTVSIAAALAQQQFIRSLKRIMPHINRISGFLMLLAGLYVAYYGWTEYQLRVNDKASSAGVVTWVSSLSTRVQSYFAQLPTTVLWLLVGGVTALVIGSVALSKRSSDTPIDNTAD